MKIIKLLLVLAFIQLLPSIIKAQGDILERVQSIKVMSSTRQDVERLFGKPSDELPFSAEDRQIVSWYTYQNESIEFTYSDGSCKLLDWKALKDTVIEISLNFKEYRKLSELKNKLKREKVDLNKLRMETALDVDGERHYYDDERGIHYGVDTSNNLWFKIGFYPSSKYSQFSCGN